ncbi:FKBP-type peptidyl-prolyl cis-trans isomerase [Sphingomonas lenta]|uniref:Peptidyl-prolyl cis-trans isomerase n=1 Tax=Sphingomonas lenta TaxID=1141887 RepID=A0A2A2SJ12_9SPHN|nr:FKBP-type peptidyl-prolyl cis-trans isomerase [Sphingomonas lenta]PAX09213.1 peptidylprolyl isomerase [Sphingomonas lenta]
MSNVTAVPLRPVKRGYLVWLWLGLALALVSAYALARQGDDFLSRNARASGVVTTASGLQYKVIEPGQAGGPRPTDSDLALVNYQGQFLDGRTFDQSQQPTPMPVAGVVPGFSEGLKLMPRGSRYRFWLPPQLAYGEQGAGNGAIPPNSTLVFDVQLLDFRSQAEVMQQMQGMGGMPPGMGAPPPR